MSLPWEIYPLEVVLKSEAILEILRKTTAEAASTPQHPRLSESPKHALQRNDDEIGVIQGTGPLDDQSQSSETRHTEDSTKDNQREGTRDMLRLLSHDGTEFQVSKEVGTLLAELIARVRSMEEQLAHHHRQAASSTRMADRPCTLRTFSIKDEREVWMRPSLPPQPSRPREQAGLREVNPAWVEGDRHNPARSSSWPNYTAPGMSANLSRSGLYHSRDIGQKVRKWQIRFSGAKNQSIDVFLARLEDCRVLANLTEEEVLSSL